MQCFGVVGKELHNAAIIPENVYNIDETGVRLSVPNSLEVLVSEEDILNCGGAGVGRTSIPVIEFVDSACYKRLKQRREIALVEDLGDVFEQENTTGHTYYKTPFSDNLGAVSCESV
jgi:hypothetical protein